MQPQPSVTCISKDPGARCHFSLKEEKHPNLFVWQNVHSVCNCQILPFTFGNFCNKKQANKNVIPKGLICKMEIKKRVVIKNVHTRLPKSLELCQKGVPRKCFF